MKRYVIVHRNSGLFVKNRINNDVVYISTIAEAMIFNVLTFAFEFAEKYINDGYDIYEIVLKKV